MKHGTQKVLSQVTIMPNVVVEVVACGFSTVKSDYIVYRYRLVRGNVRAWISRHAAVLLGVRI